MGRSASVAVSVPARTSHRSTSAFVTPLDIARKSLGSSWFACTVLAVLSLIAYSSTWDSYFMCDDFALIAYLHNAMSAPLSLVREFTGSTVAQYQINASMYRPLYLVNLLTSYALFGTNPAGYHLINFLAHLGSSIAFYATLRTILGDLIEPRQKQLLALAGAALFATSPLHLEVICFSASSSDSTALMLCLVSFSTFVLWVKRSSGKRILTLVTSLACFSAAILIKETAAAVPFIACAWLFIFVSRASFKRKLAQLLPFFALFATYLAARYAALGTLIGGYSGTPGEAFARTFADRLSVQSIGKVLFPINESLSNPPGFVLFLLATAFSGALLLCAFRLRAAFMKPAIQLAQRSQLDREFHNPIMTALKLDIFAAAWLIVAMLPVLPVWQASANLTGVRYFMSASAAFYLLIVWQLRSTNTVFTKTIAVSSFICLLVANISLSQFNARSWWEAALQSQRIQQELLLIAQKHPKQHIVLLNIPPDVCGTTMFLTDRMLAGIVAPPFVSGVEPDLHKRLLTTEVDRYTPQLVNVARTRQLAASDDVAFFSWNQHATTAKKLTLAPSSEETVIDAIALIPCHTTKEEGQWFELLFDRKIPRLAADFFEVHFTTKDETKAIPSDDLVVVAWPNDMELGKFSSVSAHPTGWNSDKYVFALSEQTNWISSPESNTMLLKMPHGQVPVSATIISGSQYVAKLQPATLSKNCAIDCAPEAVLNYDAASIEGATTCCLEVSRPNIQYQVFDATYRSNRTSTVTGQTLLLPALQGTVTLNERQLSAQGQPEPGYYQVRLRTTDSAGETVGFVSDPVTVRVLAHRTK